MDTIFYEAQKQERRSFYIGDVAINIASVAPLNINDYAFPQVWISKHVNYFILALKMRLNVFELER